MDYSRMAIEEVLAPGGNMAQALRALEGGADAVYIGYKEFSARAHADNFDLPEVSKITARAQEKNAHIYCALNTIVNNTELEKAIETAWELYFRGVKALIVQDLGLAYALKKFGPPLDLHASTQAVVHRPEGAKIMGDMGFSRIVLAREMTIPEIEACVKENPKLEFEVFIHGALCYAASGLCMASGIEIGRSANKGNCGQLCRTWFTTSQEEDIFIASMHDLSLGERIRDLRDIGVISYKIEGRMKPPAYAYWTAKAYKKFLKGDNDKEAYSYLEEARLIFGRNPSLGFIDGPKSESLVNNVFSQSTGIPLGTITNVKENSIMVKLGRDLHVGDGLLIQSSQGLMKGLTGHRFGVKKLLKDGLESQSAKTNDLVEIETPKPYTEEFKGLTVLLASKHDSKMTELSPRGDYRFPISLSINTGQVFEDKLSLSIEVSEFDYRVEIQVVAQASEKADGDIRPFIEKAFSETASEFSVKAIELKTLDPRIFINPKDLKELRRSFYTKLLDARSQFSAMKKAEVKKANTLPILKEAPLRASLSPLQGANKAIGMVADFETLELNHLSIYGNAYVLALVPFVLDMEETLLSRHIPPYPIAFKNFINSNKSENFLIGINNIAHLAWLSDLEERSGSLTFFLDYGLHVANHMTLQAMTEKLSGLQFAIGWLETKAADTSYAPPYFISRACVLRNSLAKERPNCPKNCSGSFSASLTQGDKTFDAYGSRCITYLMRTQHVPQIPS